MVEKFIPRSHRLERGPESGPNIGLEEGRSTLPPDFNDELDNLKLMRDKGFDSYYGVIDQIRQMAKGKDPDGWKTHYYKGWTNENFVELLRQLDE